MPVQSDRREAVSRVISVQKATLDLDHFLVGETLAWDWLQMLSYVERSNERYSYILYPSLYFLRNLQLANFERQLAAPISASMNDQDSLYTHLTRAEWIVWSYRCDHLRLQNRLILKTFA